MARTTGIPNSATNEVEYHFNGVNPNSVSSRSGAERIRPGDGTFAGDASGSRTPTEYETE